MDKSRKEERRRERKRGEEKKEMLHQGIEPRGHFVWQVTAVTVKLLWAHTIILT